MVVDVAKNSLVSYLLRIQASFSSRDELGLGFDRWREVFASQTEFAKLLPMASITLKCPELENINKTIQSN